MLSRVRVIEGIILKSQEIHGKSMLVRVSARMKLALVRGIGSHLYAITPVRDLSSILMTL